MTAPTTTDDELKRSLKVRMGVRTILALGIAASVGANILHAQDNAVGRVVAAWPPVALALTIELLARIPVHNRWLAVGRLAATAAVAGIAAWISYWHMAGVATRYGESDSSAHLIPLSVDGLVVVASICLVELGARINALTATAPQLVDDVEGDPKETSWHAPSSPTRTALHVVTPPTDTAPVPDASGGPRPVIPSGSRPATPATTSASSPRLKSVPLPSPATPAPGPVPAPASTAPKEPGTAGSDVADLVGPGRLAADQIRANGRRLTRQALVDALRAEGISVSTGRATDLLRILKEEAPAHA